MSYARDSQKRVEAIAKAIYQRSKKMEEKMGDQPVDPATGKPVSKTSSGEQMRLHILSMNDSQMTMEMMGKEARARGLSDAYLPKKWLERRMELNNRYRKLRAGLDQRTPVLSQAEGEDLSDIAG